MRMVPSSKHYNDIFKCLRDEILLGGQRKASSQVVIKEGDGTYTAYFSTETEGYYDLDAPNAEYTEKKDCYYDQDRTYSLEEDAYGYDYYKETN